MAKITKRQTLRRTKKMLVREWNLPREPLSATKLRPRPPAGLGKNDLQIRALESPIELVDFADVNGSVTGAKLAEAKTVGTLRDKIWDGIPASNRA